MAASPGQIIVRLQYSNSLGDVTKEKLVALLGSLSNYREMWLQWTLSAPVLSCCTSEKSPKNRALVSSTETQTPESWFCMTQQATPCPGKWPSCVVVPTDTILIDYWYHGTETDLGKIDTFVKTTVSSWVNNIVKFPGQVWVVSRFTKQITVSKQVDRGNVNEIVTFDKVISEGQN